MDYQDHFSTRKTPQTEPIPGSGQVANAGGGFAWAITDWQRLQRFLILGSEGGTLYATERQLTIQNAEAVVRCVKEDGQRVIKEIVEISTTGRAAQNEPALFALAICAGMGDEDTRRNALAALPQVARTGTHLFQFTDYVLAFRGWGRSLRTGISRWYTDQDVQRVAYQLVKYRQRGNWTHKGLLIQSHPETLDPIQNALFDWVVNDNVAAEMLEALPIVRGFLAVQEADNEEKAAQLIREYNLPRETVPPQFLNSRVVWEALAENMPITALIRNLGKMSSVGLLVPGQWDVIEQVTAQLTDQERLRKGRVHPIRCLHALLTYAEGQGVRGHNEWQVVSQVVDALDEAFYLCFGTIEPTNKRYMLGLDVSGSMTWGYVAGVPNLTPRMAAATMSMVTARVESRHIFTAFSNWLVPIDISASMRLKDVMQKMDDLPYGSTNCALPMIYALQKKIPVDVFISYTDNETNTGSIHPAQALQEYREAMGINAKLAVVAMTSGGFSIADPRDAGMLDFVGFDLNTPGALNQFAVM